MAPSQSTHPGLPPDDPQGRLLGGRYRLHRPIASGGMARVWEASDETLARRVAVKILHAHLAEDDSFVRRFQGEAIAAARLAHPSIVSVYDTLATDDGINAIVMELVSGTTLRSDLDEHGPLRLPAILAIGTQVADALGAAHAAGLVHRDVKPANILLSGDGRVLVADFGIAKAAEGADLTSDGSMVGTAKYLAPEQVEGKPVDGRTDLYALGVVLYEALTGKAPFVADTDTATVLARLQHDPVPPRQIRPEIPATVEAVVLRSMARRPQDRYPDAAALRSALLAAGADPGQAPAAAQAAAAGARQSSTFESRPTPSPSTSHTPEPTDQSGASPIVAGTGSDSGSGARRLWPWALIATALIAAGTATVGASIGGHNDVGPVVAVASVDDFDPGRADGGGGDGTEMQQLLGNLTDSDPATSWRTESYRTEDVHGFKGGVGLVVSAGATTALGHLELVTDRGGWSADVYLTEADPPSTIAEWGAPVARVADAPDGTVRVDLGDRTAKAVLVWFTRLADTQEPGRYAVYLSSAGLRAP